MAPSNKLKCIIITLFIVAVYTEELNARYPPETLKICDCCSIFVVKNIKDVLDDNRKFAEYGTKEIQYLSKALSRKERIISDITALTDWDACKLKMKHKLKENPNLSDEQFWDPLLKEYDIKDTMCDIYTVCLIYDGTKCLDLGSCDNERTFWVMNDIKNSKRNGLRDWLLDQLVFLAKTGWTVWSQIPFKKVIKYFNDKELQITKDSKNKPTFNKISFQHKEVKQYDDMESFDDDRTKPLSKTERKKREKELEQKEMNEESSDEMSDESMDEMFDFLPICGVKQCDEPDYIPDNFLDLVPSSGAVEKNDDNESAIFLCKHDWNTVNGVAVVLCIDCKCLSCKVCLDKEFNYKKKQITKILKKIEPFICPKCKLRDIEMGKKEKKNSTIIL